MTTSYGEDLYATIFAENAERQASTVEKDRAAAI
jgi:hypothetical protein